MGQAAISEKTWPNVLLFVLTVLTAWIAGLLLSLGYASAESMPAGATEMVEMDATLRDVFNPRLFGPAALYAAVLMIILVGHELGHYLTCRRYGIRATLPFFIPGPPFLGTFGAFIRIKSPVLFKRQFFDIGANGPIAGFLLAVPALAVGLIHSKVIPVVPGTGNGITFGEPLLFKLLELLFFGRVAAGADIVLHPVGFAGWVGLLITSLNLVPIGQLDGGHVAYALLGRRALVLSRLMVGFLAVMGVLFHLTWLLIAAVILFFEFKSKFRLQHPPVLDEDARLDPKRRLLSVLLILVFILSFIPAPVEDMGLLDILRGTWAAKG